MYTGLTTIVWQTTKVNARGQLLNANLGNGIVITNQYDQYGFPQDASHVKAGTTPVNVMTLTTEFYPLTENLKSSSNSMFGWNEIPDG